MRKHTKMKSTEIKDAVIDELLDNGRVGLCQCGCGVSGQSEDATVDTREKGQHHAIHVHSPGP
ncbi:hypothetical protein J6590_000334 [Homalodisca vitripennis]|nr:hypothetical protein J6590_000334 [Homalodisca vitripennis]